MVLILFQDSNMYKQMAKSKKHNKLVKDYDAQKSIHLSKLATQMLKNDDKNQRLKDKKINSNFLNLF